MSSNWRSSPRPAAEGMLEVRMIGCRSAPPITARARRHGPATMPGSEEADHAVGDVSDKPSNLHGRR